jgi:hypothetical protein
MAMVMAMALMETTPKLSDPEGFLKDRLANDWEIFVLYPCYFYQNFHFFVLEEKT